MFASPLPPVSDLPSLASINSVGTVNISTQEVRSPEGQHRHKHPNEYSVTKTVAGKNTTPEKHRRRGFSVQRQPSEDPESRDLNLTASLEAFVAGIQGVHSEEQSASGPSTPPEVETRGAIRSVRPRIFHDSHVGTVGEHFERRVVSTMEDYGRSSLTRPAMGSIFPEAYTNSYVVTKEGDPTTMAGASSSYQVVLSDGTSYPSAIFPTVSGREMVRNMLPQPVTSETYSTPTRAAAELTSYPSYVEASPYVEPPTAVSHTAAGTTNYYTSYYRRQFPASPIAADSAVTGDYGAPAVSLPPERENLVDTARPCLEPQGTPNVESVERNTITRLTEPILLVDGVMGLPLKGQTPFDRGTALLSNPLSHNRESRLLTAKKKLLSRPMQLIHVNRWDGKEVLTVG